MRRRTGAARSSVKPIRRADETSQRPQFALDQIRASYNRDSVAAEGGETIGEYAMSPTQEVVRESEMQPTKAELARVKQSFEDLRPHHEPTSYDFYESLFRRAPDLRDLFREDLKGQGMRFMNTLGLVLDDMADPTSTKVNYAELGHLHATLGVRKAHFGPMEEALMETLGKRLTSEFTPQLEAAWRRAFEAFSSKLIEAGNIPD